MTKLSFFLIGDSVFKSNILIFEYETLQQFRTKKFKTIDIANILYCNSLQIIQPLKSK